MEGEGKKGVEWQQTTTVDFQAAVVTGEAGRVDIMRLKRPKAVAKDAPKSEKVDP